MRFRDFRGLNGGALVLGQDQDSVSGGFQAFDVAVFDIAYIFIYSKALSEAELEQRARPGFTCPARKPFAAAWVFDTTNPTKARDISGRGHTMSVFGGPAYGRLLVCMECAAAPPVAPAGVGLRPATPRGSLVVRREGFCTISKA